jgi:L-Ala-D/L-Glu epimerase
MEAMVIFFGLKIHWIVLMQFHITPYTLQLRHAFAIATHTRTTTPVMLLEVEHEGISGSGEASMPPYLGESQESATAFLAKIDWDRYDGRDDLAPFLRYVDGLAPGNHAAKAAVDIALHDWVGKRYGFAWHEKWGLNVSVPRPTSFTIGIDSIESIKQKVREAGEYEILKVKLGSPKDREIIETIRSETDAPLRVDVNQGWIDREFALRQIEWLSHNNVELVEQPLPKGHVEDQAWLHARSPLPLIADEAVVRYSDLIGVDELYDGVNIKLMKCTGMAEARRMIDRAQELGLTIMLGCMTETSCAISAAAQLSPLADYLDLDGAALIANDPFRGMTIQKGRIVVPRGHGIGIVRARQ